MRTNTLKDLRLNRNLSLDFVSEKLNITKTYLCLLESGKRNPSDKLKVKFAELYNVSQATIFLACQLTKCKMEFG